MTSPEPSGRIAANVAAKVHTHDAEVTITVKTSDFEVQQRLLGLMFQPAPAAENPERDFALGRLVAVLKEAFETQASNSAQAFVQADRQRARAGDQLTAIAQALQSMGGSLAALENLIDRHLQDTNTHLQSAYPGRPRPI